MSPYLIGITIVLYAAILLLSSWLSARKAGNREFFGSKKGTTHWGIVGVAMISAAMSGITFISIPGSVAANSFSYLQMTLGFILGNIFITFVLIPIFYKTGVVSLYEYLRIRFGAIATSAVPVFSLYQNFSTPRCVHLSYLPYYNRYYSSR